MYLLASILKVCGYVVYFTNKNLPWTHCRLKRLKKWKLEILWIDQQIMALRITSKFFTTITILTAVGSWWYDKINWYHSLKDCLLLWSTPKTDSELIFLFWWYYRAHLDSLIDYCKKGLEEGATLVYGGKQLDRPGLILHVL